MIGDEKEMQKRWKNDGRQRGDEKNNGKQKKDMKITLEGEKEMQMRW